MQSSKDCGPVETHPSGEQTFGTVLEDHNLEIQTAIVLFNLELFRWVVIERWESLGMSVISVPLSIVICIASFISFGRSEFSFLCDLTEPASTLNLE